MDEALRNALQDHVFNQMPIRLIKLSTMELVERGDVLEYLNNKLHTVSDEEIDKMTHDMLGGQYIGREHEDTWEETREKVIQNMIAEHAGYAILSHTWLQPHSGDREVTFRDVAPSQMNSIPKSHGAGYAKLACFCQEAAERHGMSFAWMDTICINKDSTSELEESIRSMYRWYTNAAVCLVHLAQTTSFDDISRDRWFRRGWTLQELLAPTKVEFYNQTWEKLAAYDKSEPTSMYKLQSRLILRTIEETTGIDRGHLWRFKPGLIQRIGVAPIMVWATNRETTRGEDRAYSLMGIFGVSFAIAYGEGAERAFFRLIETILSSFYNSSSVLNCAGPPVSNSIHISSILPSGPECYIGRSERLATMSINIPHKPIILTHIGLHIPLLLTMGMIDKSKKWTHRSTDQPLSITPTNQLVWEANPFTLPLYDVTKSKGTRGSAVPAPESARDGYKHWVFGVWNFTDQESHVQVPEYGAAFLLLVDLEDWNFSMAKLTQDKISPRSRVLTKEVIVLQRLKYRSETIAKDMLGQMGAKYMTVYL